VCSTSCAPFGLSTQPAAGYTHGLVQTYYWLKVFKYFPPTSPNSSLRAFLATFCNDKEGSKKFIFAKNQDMSMVRRTRIISDPADFVPLLRIFLFAEYRKLLEELSDGWKTEDELRAKLGEDVKEGLHILMRSGLLESRWRMPEPGKKPEREYHTSYSNVIANFQCSLKEFADLVDVAYMDDKQFEYLEKPIMDLISAGRNSLNVVSKTLDLSIVSLKAIVKRSHKMCIRGQKIEMVKKS